MKDFTLIAIRTKQHAQLKKLAKQRKTQIVDIVSAVIESYIRRQRTRKKLIRFVD